MPDHLAILRPYYLKLILSGVKKIECRLTRTAKPPFEVLAKGQRIYLKRSSGPVVGMALARRVISRRIRGEGDLEKIRAKYGLGICARGDFWRSMGKARYCMLVFLQDVQRLDEPFRINKKDMRGWVVLDGKQGFDWPGGTD